MDATLIEKVIMEKKNKPTEKASAKLRHLVFVIMLDAKNAKWKLTKREESSCLDA